MNDSRPNDARPVLSLSELEAFDAGASPGERRRFCCPLCGQGKPRDGAHRCLSVETRTGLWKCFRCEAGGQLRESWTPREASPSRAQRARHSVKRAFSLAEAEQGRGPSYSPMSGLLNSSQETASSQGPPPTSGQQARSRVELLQREQGAWQPLAKSAGEAYLSSRGLSLEECVAAQVQFSAHWLGRPAVIFPLHDEGGTLVAAQGRYTDKRDNPKARTVGHKKEAIFLTANFWQQVKRGAPIVVTEAPIDALSLATCGFPALALCGKSGWPSWLPVKCAFHQVALAFDADEAGESGAAQLAPVLTSLGAKTRRLVPEGAKDWNEMLGHLGAARMGDWLCLHFLLEA